MQLITQIAGELMSGPANDFLGKNNFIYTTAAARIIETRKMGMAEDHWFPGKGVLWFWDGEGHGDWGSAQLCHSRRKYGGFGIQHPPCPFVWMTC